MIEISYQSVLLQLLVFSLERADQVLCFRDPDNRVDLDPHMQSKSILTSSFIKSINHVNLKTLILTWYFRNCPTDDSSNLCFISFLPLTGKWLEIIYEWNFGFVPLFLLFPGVVWYLHTETW